MNMSSISKILMSSALNYLSQAKLFYIVENANWSIKHDGEMITCNLSSLKSRICMTHLGIRNAIIHYGSINTFMNYTGLKRAHKSNKIIVTWFHVSPDDKRLNLIPEAVEYVDLWHTSCQLTKSKLVEYGIPEEIIAVVPLGVDLNHFKKPSLEEKEKIKAELNVPLNKTVIGSFQKDGHGWGEGLDPKLIKGPDIFCNVVEKLAKKYDIFVLLTGPARGYVKNRLTKAKIPFRHDFLDTPNDVAKYYKSCDMYMVTSRAEGGPKSILESLACGVPLVSTKVGMVPDIIENGQNGFIVDIDDEEGLFDRTCCVLEDNSLKKALSENGFEIVRNYDWKNIANQYYENMYKGLL